VVVNILIWHVHGSWMTNFVRGGHRYLVPVVPDRGPDGRGRARTWAWPSTVVEVEPCELADAPVDVVVVQCPRELMLAEAWLGGRRPGRDVPVVWLEHNVPQGRIADMRHPARDRDDVTVVHVTHTNSLMWDTGATRTCVIEHGVADPGCRWTGAVPAAGVVVNEPVRRGRVTGTDLLPRFAESGRIDVFGIGAGELTEDLGRPTWLAGYEDLPQSELHDRLALRRCYLHPFRWTSLGLSLVEAMFLGMPVVALATTEVPEAVPPGCGVVTNDVAVLVAAVRRLHCDEEWANDLGAAARQRALDRFGLDRFLADWDQLLEVIST
jgi:glycosyltransferase involved in cell wall biosynthesis